MARAVLIEIFQVEVFVPKDLSTAASAAVRRTLKRPTFRARLTAAIRDVITHHPHLKTVTVKVCC